MLRSWIATRPEVAPLVLRLCLGAVMFPHGAQKVLGWFGGHGFAGTMQMFTHGMGLPPFLAVLAILTEFVGALMLLVGLFGRFAALAIGIEMLVAVGLIHWPNGFFMNWGGTQHGEGFEYHLLLEGIVIALVITGSGAWSLDRLIARRAGEPAAR